MSLSLVVFRLEIKEDSFVTPDFFYQAPQLLIQESDLGPNPRQRQSYADAARGGPCYTKEEVIKLWGSRKFANITIETYTPSVDNKINDGNMSKCDRDIKCVQNNPVEDEESPNGNPKNTLPNLEKANGSYKSDKVAKTLVDIPVGAGAEGAEGAAIAGALDSGFAAANVAGSLEDEDGASRPGSGKSRSTSPPPSLHFFSGNPAVEITEGILHFYKQDQMTPLTEEVPRSEMICILAVPATFLAQDLLQFLTPVEPYLESIKIIRDATPNQYMVLLKFRGQKYADEFYNAFNNMPFNSIEPHVCQLVYVAKLETMKSSEGASLPVLGLTELPSCPVCLERMDESVDGILTILCNHAFHSSCLARWEDTSCPVCRYIQTPEPVPDNQCSECNGKENLWICLICGNVGCGRYREAHAYLHFKETNHAFALQLGQNRVWDYAGDNYVHRLVQSKGDGKMVEIVDERGHAIDDNKLDSVTLEYTYLLTSQLESQRHYFEERIEHIEKEALKQVEEADAKSAKSLEALQRVERQLGSLQKEKQMMDKKSTTLTSRLNKVITDLEDERDMNKSLQQNQAQWQTKVNTLERKLEEKDKEMTDLQEQMRDLMFYLEAQDKLQNCTDVSQKEIEEGQVVMEPAGACAMGTSKKHRKKGR